MQRAHLEFPLQRVKLDRVALRFPPRPHRALEFRARRRRALRINRPPHAPRSRAGASISQHFRLKLSSLLLNLPRRERVPRLSQRASRDEPRARQRHRAVAHQLRPERRSRAQQRRDARGRRGVPRARAPGLGHRRRGPGSFAVDAFRGSIDIATGELPRRRRRGAREDDDDDGARDVERASRASRAGAHVAARRARVRARAVVVSSAPRAGAGSRDILGRSLSSNDKVNINARVGRDADASARALTCPRSCPRTRGGCCRRGRRLFRRLPCRPNRRRGSR